MHGSRLPLPLLAALLACGGPSAPRPPPRAFTATTPVPGDSPFVGQCEGVPPSAGSVLYRGSAVEPRVAADPRDRTRLVGVWQQDRWANGGARGLLAAASQDGGKTWTACQARFTRFTGGTAQNGGDYERGSDPWVSVGPDGTFHQVGFAFDREVGSAQAILASRSVDGGLGWSDPIALARETDPDIALDKESLTADPKDALLAYATWDRLTGVTNPDQTQATGPAWFTRTVDGGQSWEDARPVYDPGKNAQTLGNQVLVLPDGTLLLATTVLTGIGDLDGTIGMSLTTLRSNDHGLDWSGPQASLSVESVGPADPKTRRAIRSGTDLFSAAVDPSTGALYLAWEDARFSKGLGPGVALARSDDGGKTFSAPVQVNGFHGAQAFTPTVAVAGSGEVAVLYYDLRDDDPGDPSRTGARAWLARSLDGGLTFAESAVGDLFDLRFAPFSGGLFLGDYQGLAASADGFLPFFVRTTGTGARVETVPW